MRLHPKSDSNSVYVGYDNKLEGLKLKTNLSTFRAKARRVVCFLSQASGTLNFSSLLAYISLL